MSWHAREQWVFRFCELAFGGALEGRKREALLRALEVHARLAEILPETAADNLIESSKALGLTREKFLHMAVRRPSLLYQAPSSLARRAGEIGAILGLEPEAMARKAAGEGGLLLTTSPAAVENKILDIANGLRLSREDVVGMAVKSSLPLGMRADVVVGNGLALQKLLEVDAAGLKRVLRSRPALLVRKTESLEALMDEFAAGTNLPLAAIRILMARHPGLLMMKASTMVSNIRAFAEGFGLSLEEMAFLAGKCPSLCCMRAENVMPLFAAMGERLGLLPEEFGGVVRRAPMILERKPETLEVNLRLLASLTKMLGRPLTEREVLLKEPRWCMRGKEAIEARYLVAGLGLWSSGLGVLMVTRTDRIQAILHEHGEKLPAESRKLLAIARGKKKSSAKERCDSR